MIKLTYYPNSWRRIKHDFLHHFKMPRCDLLAWILVTKLAPFYYVKLDRLLVQEGRYRELSSWRKNFKKQWKTLETRDITMPLNDAYRPDAHKWICTCPSFVTSRFLLCKHLVQSVHRVPPVFFLQVKRNRSTPFWRHENLRVLDENGQHVVQGEIDDSEIEDDDNDNDLEFEREEEDDLDWVGDLVTLGNPGCTYDEAMDEKIELITDFLAGLKFQKQFRDQRMLEVLDNMAGGFIRLARACLGKERRLKRRGGEPLLTWDKSTIASMFYRARPTDAEK